MRTRSEWFLGDGGCGDEDGEHDAETCECGGVGGPAVVRRNGPALGAHHNQQLLQHPHAHHQSIISADEMDFVSGTCRLPMLSKRPVTQLFETTSGFGIPESERERNGQRCATTDGDVTNLQHLTSNMGRKARSVHGAFSGQLEQRIVEEEGDVADDADGQGSVLHGGDRFCLIADTHDAPSFTSTVTSSPNGRVDGNNNHVKGLESACLGNGSAVAAAVKRRSVSQADSKYDEICVANSSGSNHGSGTLAICDDGTKSVVKSTTHDNSNKHGFSQVRRRDLRGLSSHLTKSHDDLTIQIGRNNRHRRSTRSSASLNRSQQSEKGAGGNDNKLMVLFKIIDFIF